MKKNGEKENLGNFGITGIQIYFRIWQTAGK